VLKLKALKPSGAEQVRGQSATETEIESKGGVEMEILSGLIYRPTTEGDEHGSKDLKSSARRIGQGNSKGLYLPGGILSLPGKPMMHRFRLASRWF